jgi:hypothetical protein
MGGEDRSSASSGESPLTVEQAFACGWLIASAMQCPLAEKAYPQVDEHGNYLNCFTVELKRGGRLQVTIEEERE